MKCIDCNYKETIAGVNPEESIVCAITTETHEPVFDCNCNNTRLKRDKEARLLADRELAEKTLSALRDQIGASYINTRYLLDILTDADRSAVEKVADAISYVEGFV